MYAQPRVCNTMQICIDTSVIFILYCTVVISAIQLRVFNIVFIVNTQYIISYISSTSIYICATSYIHRETLIPPYYLLAYVVLAGLIALL